LIHKKTACNLRQRPELREVKEQSKREKRRELVCQEQQNNKKEENK